MASSLIKKITATVDRLPEGIQRAQATIQGMPHFDRYTPPFFCPHIFLGLKAPSLILRPVWTAPGGVRETHFFSQLLDRRVIPFL